MECAVKGCKNNEIEVFYYKKPICEHHWQLHCQNKTFDLKKKLVIKTENQLTLV